MKRTGILLLILWMIVLLLTGCWSRRELSDLAIAIALGVDWSEQGYSVSIQVVNPTEIAAQAEGYDAPVTTYTIKAETIFEALRKLTTQTPRKIYLGHLRMVIFGEELAAEGIGRVLDYLTREHELRTDFYFVVAKGRKAKQVLEVLTPLEKVPANNMFDSLEMSTKTWAATGNIQLDKLISDITSLGKHPVLTGIQILGDPVEGRRTESLLNTKEVAALQYSGLAVFKKDKLVGWLNEDESKGYNYSQDQVQSTVVNIPCANEGVVGLEIIRTKSSTKGKVEQGRPHVNLEIKVEANVVDVACRDVDLTNTQDIYKLEQQAAQDIKTHIEHAVQKAQKEYKADIFGFGEAIHRGAPKAWKELKDDWDKEFEDLVLNINIDFKIRRIGKIGDSFIKEIKE